MEVTSKKNGFTLFEMLIVLAVLGILASVGLPSFSEMMSRMSANSAAKSVSGAINLARSEAVKRGFIVGICSSTTGAGCVHNNWNSGWIVYVVGTNEVIKSFQPLAEMNLSFSGGNTMLYNSRGFGENSAIVNFSICPINGASENARQLQIGISGRARLIHGTGC